MRSTDVVTLYRPDGVSGRLVCLGTVPAHIYLKRMIRNDGAGTFRNDCFDVRIGRSHIEEIRPGDLIFFGRAESSCVRASECRRIETVTENGHCTYPHWHLAAEYLRR